MSKRREDLFNRNGFENASVNQIMAAAGLTRGGFYNYFPSKTDLYVEVLSCFFTDPNWQNTWEGVDIDLNAARVVAMDHREFADELRKSCMAVALKLGGW